MIFEIHTNKEHGISLQFRYLNGTDPLVATDTPAPAPVQEPSLPQLFNTALGIKKEADLKLRVKTVDAEYEKLAPVSTRTKKDTLSLQAKKYPSSSDNILDHFPPPLA